LPGVEQDRLAEVRVEKNPAGAFEHDELDESVRVKLEHDRRAGDGRGHSRSVDPGPASIFRHLQEHGPAAQLQVARPFVERENGIGSQSGEGLIAKDELGARLHAGPHRSAVAHFVGHHSGARGGLPREQGDLSNDLADASFVQGRGRRGEERTKEK
jgi:hypothetical protein